MMRDRPTKASDTNTYTYTYHPSPQTAEYWVQQVAADLNKTEAEVMSLWDTPVSDPMRLAYRRFITASLYYDQVRCSFAFVGNVLCICTYTPPHPHTSTNTPTPQ